jgi:hypothetical protein
MNEIKLEPIDFDYNDMYASCSYYQPIIPAENEPLPIIDYKETEIWNLRQQIESFAQELDEKDKRL